MPAALDWLPHCTFQYLLQTLAQTETGLAPCRLQRPCQAIGSHCHLPAPRFQSTAPNPLISCLERSSDTSFPRPGLSVRRTARRCSPAFFDFLALPTGEIAGPCASSSPYYGKSIPAIFSAWSTSIAEPHSTDIPCRSTLSLLFSGTVISLHQLQQHIDTRF